MDDNSAWLAGAAMIGLWLAAAAAWVTHVAVTIMAKAWVLLLVGALVPPVGVVHGVLVWLGYSWL